MTHSPWTHRHPADSLEGHIRRAFGERIRELRQERGWSSQEAFSHHISLDRTYLSAIERGRRNPTLEVSVRIARGIEVAPTELLTTIEY